jgi:lysine 2,3-aminomutase
MKKVEYYNQLKKVRELSDEEQEKLENVAKKFVFRSNDYYSSLINWENPRDPIRRLIIPDEEELVDWGSWDASNEKDFQVLPGFEHKYSTTGLLLVNKVCAAYCRFCFRKRLFKKDNDEVVRDISGVVNYIRDRPSINTVLLSGGDPLMVSTAGLSKILKQLVSIEHLQIIRIGTKMPSFNPYRITDDASLLELLSSIASHKQLYVMAHFSHAVEFTDIAKQSTRLLKDAGATIVNQTPIIRGVNDSVEAMSHLFSLLSANGIQPYYVFACRPTLGNKTYAVPIEEAYQIFEYARKHQPGLGKTARFVLSHHTGKLEVISIDKTNIYFKNHNMVDPETNGELRIFSRRPDAYWFDDYVTKN